MELVEIPVFILIRARLIDYLLEELGSEGATEDQVRYFRALCEAYWRDTTISELLDDASFLLPDLEFCVVQALAVRAEQRHS